MQRAACSRPPPDSRSNWQSGNSSPNERSDSTLIRRNRRVASLLLLSASLSSLSPHNYAHTHSGTQLLLLLQTPERRGGRITIMRCDLKRSRAPSHLIRVVERSRTLSESSARRHDTRRDSIDAERARTLFACYTFSISSPVTPKCLKPETILHEGWIGKLSIYNISACYHLVESAYQTDNKYLESILN